jgi:tRNA (guanine-N7-)-methyltransferase
MTEPLHRSIRSFVLRKGRLTSAQQQALDELWPLYGIDSGVSLLEFSDHFARHAETILEIGFGNGESTWQMAQLETDKNFIGVEVHEPGVGQLLMALRKNGIENVRVARADAVPFIQQRIAVGSLAGVRIYFPDPWPKKRHHKEVMASSQDFENLSPQGDYCERPAWRPHTKYEKRGEDLGHEVRDLLYRRR